MSKLIFNEKVKKALLDGIIEGADNTMDLSERERLLMEGAVKATFETIERLERTYGSQAKTNHEFGYYDNEIHSSYQREKAKYEIGEKIIYLGRESTVKEVDNELNTMRIETSCGLTKWISQSDV
jgi:hypothetical protein